MLTVPTHDTPPVEGPELFFGLVAPVGVELSLVAKALQRALDAVNYKTHEVNVIDVAASLGVWELPDEKRYDLRVKSRMDFGNRVRADIGLDGLILPALAEIQSLRKAQSPTKSVDNPLPRTAYIIRSLKTPDEVKTLRNVYRENCYIVAAYSPNDIQFETLARQIAVSQRSSPDIFRSQAMILMQRDRNEAGVDSGQNLRDTFPLADVFLDCSSPPALEKSSLRFIEILFGHPFRTPTQEELGMFLAYGASLRSSSAGRQVGACITTNDGEVVATGTNEVPKAGGGQYWEGDTPDSRDHHRPHDSSATLTDSVLADLIARLKKKRWLSNDLQDLQLSELLQRMGSEGLLKKMSRNEGEHVTLSERALIRDIIEFMRAVHAEMAAIASAARRGVTLQGTAMYATAFPCHECARHIIAVGVSKVFFVDPYPKSRVAEMFDDSISIDEDKKGRIPFRAFTGISPRLYADAFQMPERKRNDKWLEWDALRKSQLPRKFVGPVSYLEKEDESIGILHERLTRLSQRSKV